MSSDPIQVVGGSSGTGTGGDENRGEVNSTETQVIIHQRQRKLTSEVWKDFTKFKSPSGEDIAKCNHCKKHFVGDNSKGTSHLKKHLSTCKGRTHKVIGQQLIQAAKRTADGAIKLENYRFNQENSRRDLAIMIIKHNYPFNMVDHEFFEIFCKGLNPNFKVVSRNTIRTDIINVHQEEKDKLYSLVDELSCRITLTTDLWTSDHQNIAYACLTAHYIDDDWKLKKKILNYKAIEYPHDGETLFRFISDLILEWNIDKKMFSMVVDNATSNDVMVRHLKSWLCDKSLLPLSGEMFHVRCSAHILNLIAQDGLKAIGGLLNKVRDTVRYLSRSPYRKHKFDSACNQVKLRVKKKVPMDVSTRWNSTYLMLETALCMKEAFVRLELIDRNYKHNPSEEEWQVASLIKDCLKVFYDATRHFSGTNFPTANVFFGDVCQIQLLLMEWENSEHECIRLMVGPMKEKFLKYWDESCLVLATAVVLDPRFKMDFVEYYYTRIYGPLASNYINRVCGCFVELFNEYVGDAAHFIDPISCGVDDGNSCSCTLHSTSPTDTLSDFDKYVQTRSSNIRAYQKSEVEQYLEEPVFPRKDNFSILSWWKINSPKFPILAKMARDILAIPATTVASESAFSIGGRVIDETRASLLPEIVEALVTTGDWIESTKKIIAEENAVEIVPSSK